MRWIAHYADRELPAAPGQDFPREGLVGISCQDHYVPVVDEDLTRLERTSVGGQNWKVGLIYTGGVLHLVTEKGDAASRRGWGTDVMTAAPHG